VKDSLLTAARLHFSLTPRAFPVLDILGEATSYQAMSQATATAARFAEPEPAAIRAHAKATSTPRAEIH
jgi:hypothetical protein